MAGGFHNGQGILKVTEIYNTETRAWRVGPPLPEPLYYVSSVQYEDTFLLVGGYGDISGTLDTIYQYDQTSETWILRPERLSTGKRFMGVVLAGPPAADCS